MTLKPNEYILESGYELPMLVPIVSGSKMELIFVKVARFSPEKYIRNLDIPAYLVMEGGIV